MSRTATVLVTYLLSEEGKKAALAAGLNAGEKQTIVLRCPGYEAPTPPVDAVASLTEAVAATAEAATEAKASPDLVVVAKALVESVNLLAKVLDPGTDRNVTVEQADEELWALATSMAYTDKDGIASIAVRQDGRHGTWVEGYTVEYEARNYRSVVHEKTSYAKFDRVWTAAELLRAERDRRAALKEAEKAAFAEGNALAQRKAEERHAESVESALTMARYFLEREGGRFGHLPEVAAVKALVDAGNKLALYADGQYEQRPIKAAEDAVYVAKRRAEFDEKAAWVREHGSDHARRLLAEMGKVDDTMYADERLAAERPGWKYGESASRDYGRTPNMDEMDRLAVARGIDPKANLEPIRTQGRDVVLRPFSSFLGRTIYYTGGSSATAEASA